MRHPNTLHNALRDSLIALIDSGVECTLADVIAAVESIYPEIVEAESERLIGEGLKSDARAGARAAKGQGLMMRTLGVPLPVCFAVKSGAKYVYVKSLEARWSDLQGGLDVLEENYKNVRNRLFPFENTLGRLRPYMKHDPTCTVKDALRKEAEQRRAN